MLNGTDTQEERHEVCRKVVQRLETRVAQFLLDSRSKTFDDAHKEAARIIDAFGEEQALFIGCHIGRWGQEGAAEMQERCAVWLETETLLPQETADQLAAAIRALPVESDQD